MAIQSITTIRERRDLVKEKLKNFSASSLPNRYGPEQELDGKESLDFFETLLSDITSLTKAPKRFVLQSSKNERDQIISSLANIHAALNQNNFAQAVNNADQLKTLIRQLSRKDDDSRIETLVEKTEQVDSLSVEAREKAKELEYRLSTVEEVFEKIDDYKNKIEITANQFKETFNDFTNIIEDADRNSSQVQKMANSIEQSLSNVNMLEKEVMAHKELISSFNDKISQREIQFEDQEEQFKVFSMKLETFTSERNKYLTEAENLIKSARNALGLKTAEGLSSAFAQKLQEAKDDKWTLGWIISAALFLLASVFSGLWAFSTSSDQISLLLARLTLIPIFLGGSAFCATQYVKHRNIIEDYAYKNVLAMSLVGFSEQLEHSDKGELHSHFVKSVLEQIHNDPSTKHLKLKHQTVSSDTSDLLKLLKELQQLQKPYQSSTD